MPNQRVVVPSPGLEPHVDNHREKLVLVVLLGRLDASDHGRLSVPVREARNHLLFVRLEEVQLVVVEVLHVASFLLVAKCFVQVARVEFERKREVYVVVQLFLVRVEALHLDDQRAGHYSW